MQRGLRASIERVFPAAVNALRTWRNRRYFRRRFSELQRAVRTQAFADDGRIIVPAGPFKGMRYLDETVWGSITPKWLGSYEAELHGVIETILRSGYDRIIDVGCAEGYYAVGLALKAERARVLAFDTDHISRSQLARMARLNGVESRIEIGQFCTHADLDRLSLGTTLVICDIEGFETELLDPQKADSLRSSDVLVEIHEISPDSTTTEELIVSRFRPTHQIERIVEQPRADWIERNAPEVATRLQNDGLRAEAMAEHRATGKVWLWMKAAR